MLILLKELLTVTYEPSIWFYLKDIFHKIAKVVSNEFFLKLLVKNNSKRRTRRHTQFWIVFKLNLILFTILDINSS